MRGICSLEVGYTCMGVGGSVDRVTSQRKGEHRSRPPSEREEEKHWLPDRQESPCKAQIRKHAPCYLGRAKKSIQPDLQDPGAAGRDDIREEAGSTKTSDFK